MPCVRSCAAPALGTWMCSSPESPPLFIKEVNPRSLISVFLKSSRSVLLHPYSLFKDPRCPSTQNHLRSAPSLLQSQFAFPLHSYSSKQCWVMGSWDGGIVGWRDHGMAGLWDGGGCAVVASQLPGVEHRAPFPAPWQERGPMAAHGLSAARRSRDAGNEAQERVRSRPRLPTSFLSVHLVNNACRRLFIFV